MTDQLRALAEAKAVAEEAYLNPPGEAFIQGFIAGRTSAADEIKAELHYTEDETLDSPDVAEGLARAEKIARAGR